MWCVWFLHLDRDLLEMFQAYFWIYDMKNWGNFEGGPTRYCRDVPKVAKRVHNHKREHIFVVIYFEAFRLCENMCDRVGFCFFLKKERKNWAPLILYDVRKWADWTRLVSGCETTWRCELTCKKNLKKTICEVSSISDTKRLLHLHKAKILKFQWRLSLRPCCCSLMSVDGSTRAEV